MTERSFNDQLTSVLPALLRYAIYLTRSQPVAHDLVQDTIARAILKQHLWQSGTNLRTWMFTIMKNIRVNDIRKVVNHGTAVDIEEIELPVVSDPTLGLVVRDLAAALGRLPPVQREAVMLVCYRGMRYDDAAALIGVPIGTIRSRLNRAREELRVTMDR